VLRRSAIGGEHQSCHNRLRNEYPTKRCFFSETETPVVIEEWRGFYTRVHQPSRLGFRLETSHFPMQVV
jgi:hypothetical protein